MKDTETAKIREFQEIIGYQFRDTELLTNALTHSSYVNESKDRDRLPRDNERLEFFGDAIIEFLVSEYLYRKYADIPEGDLTRLRAALVCEKSLAECSRHIRLGEFLQMGRGEELSGGRERDSITSDAFEAVTAAIYLDAGREAAETFLMEHMLKVLENQSLFYDAKTRLQEVLQQHGNVNIRYELISEEGPGHNKTFVTAVYLNDVEIGRGSGHSKKAAQQKAAEAALNHLTPVRKC